MKFNLYLAATASAWLLTILVIITEISKPFKEFLKNIFTHHWIAKAVIITLAFIIFGLIQKKTKKDIAWYSVIGSLITIFVFYIIEYIV